MPDSAAEVILSPSEFVALTNQVMDTAFGLVTVEGEVSELRIRKDRWLYLKLKDQSAVVDCFGSVYQLKQPLEDGLLVRVTGRPRLSQKWGFSLSIEQITPVGDGAIRRTFELLKARLEAEGLFDPASRRPIPAWPKTIGLISSEAAAGATDFLTILAERWGGAEVLLAPVLVQGQAAPGQIASAIDYFNHLQPPADVLVLVRGGGSLEDLMAFNSEQVARAVAGSRTPIVVGVGHEEDVTLADLAADVRAATPTHAAGLIVPDRRQLLADLAVTKSRLSGQVQMRLTGLKDRYQTALAQNMKRQLSQFEGWLDGRKQSLSAYDPQAVLQRGYSILSAHGRTLTTVSGLSAGDTIEAKLSDGQIKAEVKRVKRQANRS